MADAAEFLTARRMFSQKRLSDLGGRLGELPEVRHLDRLCIYATGSYARSEASEHSDIDLFFVHNPTSGSPRVSRLDELRLFARVIEVAEQMGFPTFSNDGEYLRILSLNDMLAMLGGPSDDYENYFTARMLLLLESAAILNVEQYTSMTDAVIEAYFRDYPNHAAEFRPVFLINDIIRFWKTLCLNYEHRRNKPDDDKDSKRKQQVKNFKLKFSRLMSCFGTTIAVCAMSSPISKEQVVALTRQPPLHRFLAATEGKRELDEVRHAILHDYEWFTIQTGLTTEDLRAQFESTETKTELFRRADVFGDRMYQVLNYFATRNRYSRYLVI